MITLTPSPAITAYAAGQAFYWIASGANTTNVTVNVSGLGAKAVTKNGTTALVAGDIPSGALVGARYDGTRFQLLGPGGSTGIPLSLIDAAGDWIQGSAADTAARFPAAATVAAHATTCDPWGARVVTLSGSAVTFTDLADADYVGQRVLLIMNAAHIWTDGAVFDVQGGATYTTAAGDWVELVATAVDAFDVTIIPTNPAATQAQQETGTDATKYVTPGRQQFHQSAAKAWLMCDAAGNINASYNVASISDDGTGLVTVTISTDFSGTSFAAVGSVFNGGVIGLVFAIIAQAAGSIGMSSRRGDTDALADPSSWYVVCFGDQA